MPEGAYARSGVDQSRSADAVGALVGALAADRHSGAPSRAALGSGHYANVLRLDERRGLALSCDGVGTKVIVCEELRRFDTVGIDLVAMNANDIVCVGAEPIALLDYVAVEEADPEALGQIGEGLRRGAELAGIEIPGGELAVLPELIRGHPSPHGFDLAGFCVGLVDLDAIVTGRRASSRATPIVGLPSSGIHSNGLTLARSVLPDLDERPAELGGASVGETLLEPTVIYVRAVRELLDSAVDVRGLAHITGRGLPQPAPPRGRGGLPPGRAAASRPPVFRPDRGARRRWSPPSSTRCSTWAAASAAWCPPPTPRRRWSCSPATTPAPRWSGEVTPSAGRGGAAGAGAGGPPRCRLRRPPDATPAPRAAPVSTRTGRTRPSAGQPPELRLRGLIRQVADRLHLHGGHPPEAPQRGERVRPRLLGGLGAGGQRGGAPLLVGRRRPTPRPSRRRRRSRIRGERPRPSRARLLQVRAERLHDRVRLQVHAEAAPRPGPASRATSTSGSAESSLRRKHISPSRTALR